MRKVEIRYCPVWPTKKFIASRVAAQLKQKENDVEVKVVRGGLLELSVIVDGKKVIDTNRLWYPTPSSVVRRTRELLHKEG